MSHFGIQELVRKRPEGWVTAQPLVAVLEQWMAEAKSKGNAQSDAMVLATATPKGVPAARVVLYKGWTDAGLLFVTNYTSNKSRDLESNPQGHLVFYWTELGRQIRVQGNVKKAPRTVSESYFASRPRESQLGAWASRQSRGLASYEDLMDRYAEFEKKFQDQKVPCPPHWGGYLLQPKSVELWVGQVGRLHQRMLFRRKGTRWIGKWLSP